jgi:gliding motility-associated-like protein
MLIINNTSTGGNSYTWTFGTNDTANAFEPLYTYYNEGDYVITLIVTSMYGCSDTANAGIHVRKHESIYIPNVFTPNENHLNDYFSIVGENLKSVDIRIFDRWGEVIYQSSDKHFRWDGTYNGSPVQQGIYAYIITAAGYNGEDNTYKGTITVLR